MDSTPPILQVAAKAAIMNSSGKVLIMREAPTGKNNVKVGQWGLIGGRIEPHETFMQGLKREVREETSLDVDIMRPLYVGEWHPVIHGQQYKIIAVFMLCKAQSDQVRSSPEHDLYEWINPKDRTKYAMMEPDCFVVDEIVNL